MNRFAELIEKLKERAAEDEHLKATIEEPEASEKDVNHGKEHGFRLPYSSDPRPIEKPWN